MSTARLLPPPAHHVHARARAQRAVGARAMRLPRRRCATAQHVARLLITARGRLRKAVVDAPKRPYLSPWRPVCPSLHAPRDTWVAAHVGTCFDHV
eukprot:1014293-Pleurochrysis_carterae.AAC.1